MLHVGYCIETVENTTWMKLCFIDHDQMVRLLAVETMYIEGSMDYSKTSNSGPSKIGTKYKLYNRPLYKGHFK